MNKIFLYFFIFSLAVSLTICQSAVPLRGTAKDTQKQPSDSESDKNLDNLDQKNKLGKLDSEADENVHPIKQENLNESSSNIGTQNNKESQIADSNEDVEKLENKDINEPLKKVEPPVEQASPEKPANVQIEDQNIELNKVDSEDKNKQNLNSGSDNQDKQENLKADSGDQNEQENLKAGSSDQNKQENSKAGSIDQQKQDLKAASDDQDEQKNSKSGSDDQQKQGLKAGSDNQNEQENQKVGFDQNKQNSKAIFKSEPELKESENVSVDEASECAHSFVMWFRNGVAVTTISCQDYSTIYTAPKTGEFKPRYIIGEIEGIEIDELGSVKVNGVDLETVSTDIEKPTQINGGESETKRTLDEVKSLDNNVSYSFPIDNKEISVKLVHSNNGKTDKYTLSCNGETFYSGSENNLKYSFNSNGDLVDSNGKIVLKEDSNSSAPKSIYILSSLFALITSFLLYI